MEKVTCQVSRKEVPITEAHKAEEIQDSVYRLIRKDHPELGKDDWISIDALNVYRKNYLSSLVQQEIGELNKLEKEVIDAITSNKILSDNIEVDLTEDITFGQRLADKIASFGGSWTFIVFFFSFILVWMGINVWALSDKAFDKYPFILLNLILSCLAAIQAPIIMMSQNRQEQKDRLRSEHDYKINLKAELEIKLLHEKLDHLMIHQNKRLLEIQEIQAEYLEDILNAVKGNNNKEKEK